MHRLARGFIAQHCDKYQNLMSKIISFFFSSTESSILCIRSLQRIVQYHPVFKDVYREVGMLEVFVTCLHRFAALLKDPQADGGRLKIKFLAHQMILYLY